MPVTRTYSRQIFRGSHASQTHEPGWLTVAMREAPSGAGGAGT